MVIVVELDFVKDDSGVFVGEIEGEADTDVDNVVAFVIELVREGVDVPEDEDI